jgi:hypothetical protein
MMRKPLASLLAALLALTSFSAFACPGDKAKQGIQSESAPMTPVPKPPKI